MLQGANGLLEWPPSDTTRPPADRPCPSVAIVHDYLNQFGGAERVVLELARTWPGAPVYTSLYRKRSTFPEFAGQDIRVSPLNRAPVDAGFRSLAPLYPFAFRSFGTLGEDVVISSSSGWAHAVRTAAHSKHIVYCHTPARWLYRLDSYLSHRLTRGALAPFGAPFRRWDRTAARRADVYVANCENVRRRIRATYGIEAEVIHPPVDCDRFRPRPRGERLLVISRLLPYKRVDLVIRAANRLGLGLDVVGTGPCMRDLRSIAGPDVEFHGRVPDDAMVGLLERCRALCVAAEEDFGIAPVEALAAGKPVVAYAAGGALETLEDGFTATFFDRQDDEALIDAIRRCDSLDTNPSELADAARSFSAAAFRPRFRELRRPGAGGRAHTGPRTLELRYSTVVRLRALPRASEAIPTESAAASTASILAACLTPPPRSRPDISLTYGATPASTRGWRAMRASTTAATARSNLAVRLLRNHLL